MKEVVRFWGSRFVRARLGEFFWSTNERTFLVTWNVRGTDTPTRANVVVVKKEDGLKSSDVARQRIRDIAIKEFKLAKGQTWRIEIIKVKIIRCPHCELRKWVGWTHCESVRFGHIFYCGKCISHFTVTQPNVDTMFTHVEQFIWHPITTIRKDKDEEKKALSGKKTEGAFID